jgi:hypothetical protein
MRSIYPPIPHPGAASVSSHNARQKWASRMLGGSFGGTTRSANVDETPSAA